MKEFFINVYSKIKSAGAKAVDAVSRKFEDSGEQAAVGNPIATQPPPPFPLPVEKSQLQQIADTVKLGIGNFVGMVKKGIKPISIVIFIAFVISALFGWYVYFRTDQSYLADTTIVKAKGAYAYKNTTNLFHTQFKEKPTDAKSIVFSNKLGNISFYTPAEQTFGTISSTASPVTDGSTLTYSEIFPQLDLKYTISSSRLLEEFIVKSATAAAQITRIEQRAETSSTYTENSDGSITFSDNGNTVFTLPHPVMYETGSPDNKSEGIIYQIKEDGDQLVITKVITKKGLAWLTDPARTYPIAIDLVIDNADTAASWVSSDAAATTVSQETTIKQEGTGSVKVQTTADGASVTVDLMEYSSDGTAQSGYVSNGLGGITGATGGTITTSGGYTIHKFTSSGTFTPTGSGTVDYLVVAGGGGGGGGRGGGGGAGGFKTGTGLAVTAQAYTVTVGNGGGGGANQTAGSNGGNSVFSSITSTGGGGGGKNDSSGLAGGSGGGAGGGAGAGGGGAGTAGQGNNGGSNYTSAQYGAGGGGGSSSVGANGTSSNGGNGGAGTSSSISGSAVSYAGGGGGGVGSGTPGTGQAGGGNGTSGASNAGSATVNTGSGGGGSGVETSVGGNGGSGIVIVRYLTPPYLQSYSEATIKTQGTYALKGVANQTTSLNKTLTRTIASPLNLSDKASVTFDLRASRTGSNIKVGLHDTGGTTTEVTPNITSADTFQSVTIDLSGVTNANKDAIDQIIITIVNADATNTFYLDNMVAATASSLNDTVTRTTSATDLSTAANLTFWVRSSVAGSFATFGFGETAATEQTNTITINQANTWEQKTWDISWIAGSARDAVTKYAFTFTGDTSGAAFYFDDIQTNANPPATPPAPAVDTRTTTSVNVTPSYGTNSDTTQLALYMVENSTTCNGTGGVYIADNGSSNGATAVWQVAGDWGPSNGIVTVTGLSSEKAYTFCVKARNGNGTESAFSPVGAYNAGYIPLSGDFICTQDTIASNAFTNRYLDGVRSGETPTRYVIALDKGSSLTANTSVFEAKSCVMTVNSTDTLVVGSLNLTGGSIAIATGAQIKINQPAWIVDADGDGYSADGKLYYGSTMPASGVKHKSQTTTLTATDCNDSSFSANNVCCTVATRYQDADGDGYGNPAVSISACTTAGYVDNNYDCNDADIAVTTATGGTITTSSGYKIHTFTGSGTLTACGPLSTEYLIVAGGGSGTGASEVYGAGAGGGGGGMLEGTSSISAGAYSIVVGGGGQNSSFNSLTAIAGGGGNGGSGGSGGGGSNTGGAGGAGTAGQGNNGGNGLYADGGGGGGGKNGAGGNAPNNSGGAGKSSSITGAAVTYAYGGNGGGHLGSAPPPGATGGANTGGGGGGGSIQDSNGVTSGGGAGGSGIVVVRYLYP